MAGIPDRRNQNYLLIARASVLLLVGAIILYAFHLILVGQETTIIHEAAESQPGGSPSVQVIQEKYPLAFLFIVAAIPLVLGIFNQRDRGLAWLGVFLMVGFSGLLAFNGGAPLFGASIILVVLLFVIDYLGQDSPKPPKIILQ